MIPFRKSVGFRLFGVSVILLALPLLVDAFIFIQKSYKHALEDAKSYLVEASRLRISPLSGIQPVNPPFIKILEHYLKLDKNFPEKPSQEMDQKLDALAKAGDLEGIFLLKRTSEGEYVFVGGQEGLGKDLIDFSHLEHTSIGGNGIDTYISLDNRAAEPFFMIIKSVRLNEKDAPIGFIIIADNVNKKLMRLIKSDTHQFPINFALALPSSIIFAASDSALRFQYFLPLSSEFLESFSKEEPYVFKQLSSKPLEISKEENLFFEFILGGEKQIAYLKKVGDKNYYLLSYASKSTVFKLPFTDFINAYTGYVLILVVGGVIAYLLTRRMAQPMQNLSRVMLGIQKGDLNLRYKPDPLGFEINVLGQIFNGTIDTLIEKKRKAEEERVKREMLASELKLGREVQRSLLPKKMPNYPGVEIAEAYIPAIEVGGDFYDIHVRESEGNRQLVLAVADASGKGVRACLYSLGVRNMLRIYSKEFRNVADAMSVTNNLFCFDAGDTGMFVTVIMGIYDCHTHILNYSSCGHNPAVLRRADGKVEFIDHLGMAMGLIPAEIPPPSNHTKLEIGDLLLFYTDGITEAHDENFLQFGEESLKRYLEKEGGKNAALVVRGLIEEVTRFAGKAPQHDDITLLALKIVQERPDV